MINQYSWRARSAAGKSFSGKIAAPSADEAVLQLRQHYRYIVALKPCRKEQVFVRWRRSRRFTDKQRIAFFKQLAVILNSGIPLLQGIEILQQRLDKKLGTVCQQLIQRLQAGSTLHEAMSCDRVFFPPLAVTLTAAGESGGELECVLEAAAEYYARQYELKCFLYKAAAYPLFLLAATAAVSLFFLFYVLPQLAGVYTSMQVQPDYFLQWVLRLNDFVSEHTLLLAAILAGTAVLLSLHQAALRTAILQLPGIKGIYGLVQEIRFCKLLALLLNSGLNITVAAEEAGKTFTDEARLGQLYLFRQSLLRGVDIGTAAQRAGCIFSPLTREFIAIGAATGCLPHMLNEAAGILEQDLQSKLEKFRELFAPVLLLIAALLTALVVCSVMGPLFDLFTALPEYE